MTVSNIFPNSSFADSTATDDPASSSQPAYLPLLPYDIGLLSLEVDLCNSGVYIVNGQAVKLPATITGEGLLQAKPQVSVWVIKLGMRRRRNPRSSSCPTRRRPSPTPSGFPRPETYP
jgi:hypothetical protein